jgi:hypothetical protein
MTDLERESKKADMTNRSHIYADNTDNNQLINDTFDSNKAPNEKGETKFSLKASMAEHSKAVTGEEIQIDPSKSNIENKVKKAI